MTNEIQQTAMPEHKQPALFGARLKSAREALGLDPKEAAAQLRLNEDIIVMMEKDKYPSDLPPIFITGYLRAYGKLLQISPQEIEKAVEPYRHLAPPPQTPLNKPTLSAPVTSGNYFMQFFTYLIVFTMLGLVGMWWYTHTNTPMGATIDNQLPLTPENANPVAPSMEHSPATVNPNTPQTAPPTARPAPTPPAAATPAPQSTAKSASPAADLTTTDNNQEPQKAAPSNDNHHAAASSDNNDDDQSDEVTDNPDTGDDSDNTN